jgi:SAM-dependent methyltransferase
MKDNFSSQSDKYAKYRPTYPKALIDYIISLVDLKERALDCGTGNGQIAHQLADYFHHVSATDISSQQIAQAIPGDNIDYSIQPAEHTSFPDNSFDLIAVAQAIHWFDFYAFYKEVDRIMKNNGILAVIGYGRIHLSREIDSVIAGFYRDVIGPYWDKERRYVDENYLTIPFPYSEITAPAFQNDFEWSFEHLVGYLETWSAVKHYEKKNGQNPVHLIHVALKKAWGNNETRIGYFPILLRVAAVKPPATPGVQTPGRPPIPTLR